MPGPLSQMSIWCGVQSSCYSACWHTFTTCQTTGEAMLTRARPVMRWHSCSSTKRWESASFIYLFWIKLNVVGVFCVCVDESLLFLSNQVFILEELLSPIVTPFILIFLLRNKSLEIIDFFRNFTVEVVGVGDICSFAQMDIRRHGNPTVRFLPSLMTEKWLTFQHCATPTRKQCSMKATVKAVNPSKVKGV